VATVRVGEESWNKNFSAHDIVPGKYKLVEPAQIARTDSMAASLGIAWTHIVNSDGVDRIMAKDGSTHSALGMHGGSSELAAEFGLDAARASHQDLRKTEGCIRMHNEDALSLSNIVSKAGGSVDFDIRGSVSRTVGVQEAVERLRTDTGFGLPPAGHVTPCDGKPHEGTFVRVDDHTWAQHLGRGSYQTYDVDHDLRGNTPVEGQRMEVDARGQVSSPHEVIGHGGR
jgi:hypothetical protein